MLATESVLSQATVTCLNAILISCVTSTLYGCADQEPSCTHLSTALRAVNVYRHCKLTIMQDVQKSKLYSLNVY